MGHLALLGTNTASSTSTASVTVGSAVATGATVILSLAWSNDTAAVPTITSVVDSRGNTYTLVSSAGTGNGTVSCAILSAPVTTALQAGDTITVTITANRLRWLLQADSFDDVGARDQVAANHTPATSTAMSTGVTPTTTAANELVVACFGFGRGGLADCTLDPGWSGTAYVTTSAGSADRALQMAYKTVAAAGTQEGTATLSVASAYAACIATYALTGLPAGTGTITATAALSGTGTKHATGTATAAAAAGVQGAGAKRTAGAGTATATATLTGVGAPPVVTVPEVPVFLPGVPVGNVPAEFNAKIKAPFTGLLAPPVFVARRTGALTVAEATRDTIEWDTIDEDPYGGWSAGTPGRWVVPAGWYGWWSVTCAVSLSGTGASGMILMPVLTVDTFVTEGQEVFVPTGGGQAKSVSHTWWVYAGEGQPIELALYFSAESSITAVDTTPGMECRVEIIWDGV